MNLSFSIELTVRRRYHVALLILTATLLASCSPALPATQSPVVPTESPTPTVPIPSSVTTTFAPPVSVTPRGSELVASDPATVSLASGGLQLVEFFRFT